MKISQTFNPVKPPNTYTVRVDDIHVIDFSIYKQRTEVNHRLSFEEGSSLSAGIGFLGPIMRSSQEVSLKMRVFGSECEHTYTIRDLPVFAHLALPSGGVVHCEEVPEGFPFVCVPTELSHPSTVDHRGDSHFWAGLDLLMPFQEMRLLGPAESPGVFKLEQTLWPQYPLILENPSLRELSYFPLSGDCSEFPELVTHLYGGFEGLIKALDLNFTPSREVLEDCCKQLLSNKLLQRSLSDLKELVEVYAPKPFPYRCRNVEEVKQFLEDHEVGGNLSEALLSGEIPLIVFKETPKVVSRKGQRVNMEFDLWERALQREDWRESVVVLARSLGSRRSFTRQVTSYFQFLFDLENYLQSHSSPTIRVVPRLVQELSEEEEFEIRVNGNLVEVPYLMAKFPLMRKDGQGERTGKKASIYSHRYVLQRQGFPDLVTGDVFTSDWKEFAGSRYGFCYFTLVGSNTEEVNVTGYPSYLIDLDHPGGLKIRRVHPSRTRGKDGSHTPANELISKALGYMTGMPKKLGRLQGRIGEAYYFTTKRKVSAPIPLVTSLPGHSTLPENAEVEKNTTVRERNRVGWIRLSKSFEGIPSGTYEVRIAKRFRATPQRQRGTSIPVVEVSIPGA